MFSNVFWKLFKKMIIQKWRIIKNKVLDMKIIFKIHLKNIKNKLKSFLVFKTIFENSYQTKTKEFN